MSSNASVSSAERCAWRNPSGCVDGGLERCHLASLQPSSSSNKSGVYGTEAPSTPSFASTDPKVKEEKNLTAYLMIFQAFRDERKM
ncbi:hypothetical protein EYF80_039873 [Liparis tanakae]|uniref:Uncharacterized protein n=1 Tax=Liparis tanakae TaxID=230148 RepID=A0A4Z2G8Q8_9TELE|nr:hypothetical protein EYF80_039873 [Liparis tanakae]